MNAAELQQQQQQQPQQPQQPQHHQLPKQKILELLKRMKELKDQGLDSTNPEYGAILQILKATDVKKYISPHSNTSNHINPNTPNMNSPQTHEDNTTNTNVTSTTAQSAPISSTPSMDNPNNYNPSQAPRIASNVPPVMSTNTPSPSQPSTQQQPPPQPSSIGVNRAQYPNAYPTFNATSSYPVGGSSSVNSTSGYPRVNYSQHNTTNGTLNSLGGGYPSQTNAATGGYPNRNVNAAASVLGSGGGYPSQTNTNVNTAVAATGGYPPRNLGTNNSAVGGAASGGMSGYSSQNPIAPSIPVIPTSVSVPVFSPAQIHQLKAQITAYKKIMAGETLDQNHLMHCRKQQQQQPNSNTNNINNTSTPPSGIGNSHSFVSMGANSNLPPQMNVNNNNNNLASNANQSFNVKSQNTNFMNRNASYTGGTNNAPPSATNLQNRTMSLNKPNASQSFTTGNTGITNQQGAAVSSRNKFVGNSITQQPPIPITPAIDHATLIGDREKRLRAKIASRLQELKKGK